jgi:molybdopterin-guanine dinucleotide biosynthesis protein A
MGEDKVLLRFCGRPMVVVALEKLRGFCTDVGIAGNRDDLAEFAPVVREKRLEAGPAAGIEAGLLAAMQPWVMFMPVDVPLMPEELLRRWATAVIGMKGILASHLYHGRHQAVFCMLRRECCERLSLALGSGERRLEPLLHQASEGFQWVQNVEELFGEDYPTAQIRNWWFLNVNTPQDLADAELRATSGLERGCGVI